MADGRRVMAWARRPGAAFAATLAVAVGAFFALALGRADAFIYRPGSDVSDLSLTFWPNITAIQRSLASGGGLPLWRTAIFSGSPLDADPQSGLWYPPNLIFLLVPAAAGFNLSFVAHAVAGGLGMWKWARAEGVSAGGAAVAGLAFAFSPRAFAHLGFGHAGLFYASAYIPWALWAAGRIGRGSLRHAGTLGLALGWQAIAHAQVAFYTAGAAALYCLAVVVFADPILQTPHRGISTARRRAGPSLRGLALGGALALTVSAAQLIPSLQFAPLSARARLAPTETAVSSLPPRYLWGLVLADHRGFMDYMVYPGLPILALATAAISRRQGRFWWVFVLLAVLYALGDRSPLYGWALRLLPAQGWLRAPARVWFLAAAALCLLAGMGFDRLLRGLEGWGRYALNLAAAGLGALAVLITAGYAYVAGPPPANFVVLAVVAPLTAALFMVGASGRLPRRAGVGLAFVLVLADLWIVNSTLAAGKPPEAVFADDGLGAYLAEAQGVEPFRVYSPSYSLPQQVAALHGVETADGVDPLFLADYDAFVQAASGVRRQGYGVTVPPLEGGADVATANREARPNPAMLGLLNVRYVAAEFDLPVEGLREAARFGQTRVYENDLARPRAFVVGRVESAPGFAAALAWVKAHAAEPRAVVEGGPPLDGGEAQAEVAWHERAANRLRLTVSLDRPGFLVVSQVWYPAWRATVDGRPARLWRADAVLCGLYLEPGEHTVELVYRPPLLWLGVGLSILGVVVCVALVGGVKRIGFTTRFFRTLMNADAR